LHADDTHKDGDDRVYSPGHAHCLIAYDAFAVSSHGDIQHRHVVEVFHTEHIAAGTTPFTQYVLANGASIPLLAVDLDPSSVFLLTPNITLPYVTCAVHSQ